MWQFVDKVITTTHGPSVLQSEPILDRAVQVPLSATVNSKLFARLGRSSDRPSRGCTITVFSSSRGCDSQIFVDFACPAITDYHRCHVEFLAPFVRFVCSDKRLVRFPADRTSSPVLVRVSRNPWSSHGEVLQNRKDENPQGRVRATKDI